MKSETIGFIAAALAAAQGKILGAEKSAENPHLRTRYADLGSVWAACRDALSQNGLAVVQLPRTEYADDGGLWIVLDTILTHSSGEFFTSTMSFLVEVTKGTNELQATGRVITYLRRYALAAMVGVAPAGDDDDGASMPPAPAATKRQSPPPAPPSHLFATGDEVMVRGNHDEKAGVVAGDGIGEDGKVAVKIDGTVHRVLAGRVSKVAPPAPVAAQLFDNEAAQNGAYQD